MQLMIWCIFLVGTAGAASLLPLTSDKDFIQEDLGQDFSQDDLSQDFIQGDLGQDFSRDELSQDFIQEDLGQDFSQDDLSQDFIQGNVGQDFSQDNLSQDFIQGDLGQDFSQDDLSQDFIQGDFSQDFGQDSNNQKFFTDSRPQDRILSQRFEQDSAGNYEYNYEQGNGQAAEEVGRVQPGPLPETGGLSKQGSYRYIGDDGNTYQLSYIADKGGFQPQAKHLPQAPAQIPEYAQLRREHPEIFWAENRASPLPFIKQQQNVTTLQAADQQFDQQSLSNQQFDQQSFSNQQFDQQSFSGQQFDQQSFSGQQFDQQSFSGQQFDQLPFSGQQFDQQSFSDQQVDQQQFASLGPVSQKLSEPRPVDEIPASLLPLSRRLPSDQSQIPGQQLDQQSLGQEFSDYHPDQSSSSQLNLFGSLVPPA